MLTIAGGILLAILALAMVGWALETWENLGAWVLLIVTGVPLLALVVLVIASFVG